MVSCCFIPFVCELMLSTRKALPHGGAPHLLNTSETVGKCSTVQGMPALRPHGRPITIGRHQEALGDAAVAGLPFSSMCPENVILCNTLIDLERPFVYLKNSAEHPPLGQLDSSTECSYIEC